jgi:hypothetical protein
LFLGKRWKYFEGKGGIKYATYFQMVQKRDEQMAKY